MEMECKSPTSTMSDSSIDTASSSERQLSECTSSISTPHTESSLLFNDIPEFHLRDFSKDDQYILVVGGLGYIGSHTTWELVKEGFNVIIIDNLSNSFRSVLDRLEYMTAERYKGQNYCPSIEFYEADYRDLATLKVIFSKYHRVPNPEHDGHYFNIGGRKTRGSSIEGVIHFAGYKAVEDSISEPLKYYANNVGGLISFCSLLSDLGIKKLVFSSSAAVYGELATKIGGRLREEYCTHQTLAFLDGDGQEKTIQAGCTGLTNPYGRTKWMCEAILNDLAAADPEWTIFALRYFNPIGCDESGMLGEDPRGNPSNLMPVLVNVLIENQPVLEIYGTDWNTKDGTAVRDFIHVTDLARGHIAALSSALKSQPEIGFRTYNLGSGSGHSVLDIVTTMEAVSHKSIPTRAMDRRDGDVAICIAEPTRAKEELSWKTERTLDVCCEDIWRRLSQK
jgi:UDP-glucose 4-epimerase